MEPAISLFAMTFIAFIIFATTIFPLALGAWLIIKLTSGGKKEQATSREESRMIQEIYNGLGKMEKRVETLETLILERERKEASHDL